MDFRLPDIQQPGPLVDHLLEIPQGQPHPSPTVDENVPLSPHNTGGMNVDVIPVSGWLVMGRRLHKCEL